MEIVTPATDIDLVDSATELEPFPWGKEIAKELTLSTAQTAGVAGGFVVVAFAYAGYVQLRKHFAKKSPPAVPTITDLPQANEA